MVKIKTEIDVPVPMCDGLKLAANIHRPQKPGQYPVIMAFTGLGKGGFWSEKCFSWQIAYEPGSSTLTGLTTFEANDPAF
jgi:predicted acyl esterase